MARGKRICALLLSAALLAAQLPVAAMAENSVPEDGSIASFEVLDSGVAHQTVPVGTALSALKLPDEAVANVYHVTTDTAVPDGHGAEEENGDATASPSDAEDSVSGSDTGGSAEAGSGRTVTTVATAKEKIPVAWDRGEPAYDGETPGKYVFTADADGYVLSRGAEPPRITVTVAAQTHRFIKALHAIKQRARSFILVKGFSNESTGGGKMDGELRSSLLRLVRRKFAGYPNVSSLADDIVQDAYVRLRSSHSYTSDKENYGYLSVVCVRLAYREFMAQATNFQQIYLDGEGTTLLEESDIVNELLHAESTSAILESLKTLRDIERIVISQRYYGNFSFAQIAKANGLKLNTVLSHHRRALTRLRPQLTKLLDLGEE